MQAEEEEDKQNEDKSILDCNCWFLELIIESTLPTPYPNHLKHNPTWTFHEEIFS